MPFCFTPCVLHVQAKLWCAERGVPRTCCAWQGLNPTHTSPPGRWQHGEVLKLERLKPAEEAVATKWANQEDDEDDEDELGSPEAEARDCALEAARTARAAAKRAAEVAEEHWRASGRVQVCAQGFLLLSPKALPWLQERFRTKLPRSTGVRPGV